MTLEMKLETLDGLDENLAKLYVEKDGAFILDVAGHDKNEPKDKNMIPKHRLDAEISKRREAEKELAGIAEALKGDVPEEYAELVPDLPAGKLIPWLKNAFSKGMFDPKQSKESLDSQKPGDKKPTDFNDMTPQQIMSTGYKT